MKAKKQERIRVIKIEIDEDMGLIFTTEDKKEYVYKYYNDCITGATTITVEEVK